MKVYSAPEDIKLVPDYHSYDRDREAAKEDKYIADIKQWLLDNGYTGPRTGEIAYFPVADGNASYMFADNGRKSCLIHLEIGDAWNFQYIERLTKADIIKNLDRQKNMKALFGRR